MSGDHNDFRIGVYGFHLFKDLETVDTGHFKVCNDDVMNVILEKLNTAFSGESRLHFIAVHFQRHGKDPQDILFIVDQQ